MIKHRYTRLRHRGFGELNEDRGILIVAQGDPS
jgi:hypothetical protein